MKAVRWWKNIVAFQVLVPCGTNMDCVKHCSLQFEEMNGLRAETD